MEQRQPSVYTPLQSWRQLIKSSAALPIHLLDHLPVQSCVMPAPVSAAQSLISDVNIPCKAVIIQFCLCQALLLQYHRKSLGGKEQTYWWYVAACTYPSLFEHCPMYASFSSCLYECLSHVEQVCHSPVVSTIWLSSLGHRGLSMLQPCIYAGRNLIVFG